LTRVGRRTGVLLVVVVIGHVALISAQVNNPSGVRLFEGVTFGLFSEIQRAVSSTVGRVTWFWSGYVGLQSVHAENTVLRKDVAELQFRLQRERALAQRARGLEELLELRRNVDVSTVSARVIAGDATPYFRTVTIDRGSGDGVRRDAAVVSPDGVVGRVVSAPASRASKVQLLVDRSAAAGALIERTRVAGLVMGDVDEGVLRMEYVSNLEDVVIGDVVVTSGVDGIYPKGFVIGVVEVVQRGVGLDKTILVRPAVVFSDLEDVLVIVHDQPLLTTAAGGG
jgi:rod shape-determining protein MreC